MTIARQPIPRLPTAALEAIEAPVILIAGGKSKKTDFTHFAAAASRIAKRVILIGEDRSRNWRARRRAAGLLRA